MHSHNQQSFFNQTHSSSNQNKHLVLFVDINGTIMAADTSRGKEPDSAICQMLAENYLSKWDSVNNETYRQYIDRRVCPGDGKDPVIKSKRMNHYKQFIEYLQQTAHPLHDEVSSKFTEIKNEMKNGDIFPSFIAMIDELNSNHTPYTIVFRTFGDDLDNVIKETNKRCHLEIQNRAKFIKGILHHNNGNVFDTPEAMLGCIAPFQHAAWQDDYQHWHNHGESHEAGKLYPINMHNNELVSIFFDDNAIDKNIIHVESIPSNTDDQRLLQADLLTSGRIVAVNTLQAATDRNYFIDRVKFALSQELMIFQYKMTI